MGNGFNVNVAEVLGHTQTVATCSTQVHSATGSAQSVSDSAYGIIGQFFAAAILSACGDVVGGIAKVAASLEDVRSGLESIAADYEHIDHSNASTLSGGRA